MKINGRRRRRFDQKISILQVTAERQTSGAVDETFSVLASVFADRRPVVRTQTENMIAGRETSVQEIHFEIQYMSGLDKANAIDHDGYRHDIITIMPMGRMQTLVIVTQQKDIDLAS